MLALLFNYNGYLSTGHLSLLLLDHLLYHVAANPTCVFGRDVAVVTLLEVYAQLSGYLKLHLVQSLLGFGNQLSVPASTGIVIAVLELL